MIELKSDQLAVNRNNSLTDISKNV